MVNSRVWILYMFTATALASPWDAKPGLEARQPPASYSPEESSGNSSEHEMNNHGDYITCNQRWYGNPRIHDCDMAIAQFPGFHLPAETYREFYGILGPFPERPASGLDGPPIQTPIVKTVGSCTAVVILPSNINTSRNIIVNMRRMRHASVWLVDKCPGLSGSGGRFYHDPLTRSDYLALNGHQLPEIIVFGIYSLAQSILDNQFYSTRNKKGDVKWRPRTRTADFLSRLPQQPVHSRPQLKPSNLGKTASGSCSGSCLDMSQCSIDSNCICAADFGSSLPSQPQSWSSHACTYVASATVAMIQTKGRGGVCARGRCLLESDGTVDVAPAPDGHLTQDTELTDLPPSAANMSNPDLNDLTNAYGGIDNTTFPSFSAISDATAYTSITPDAAATPLINHPLTSNSTTSPIIPDPDSSILACPCNCTYVSPACCLTKHVWDDPWGQVEMSPLGGNASVVCDQSSGAWVEKFGVRTGNGMGNGTGSGGVGAGGNGTGVGNGIGEGGNGNGIGDGNGYGNGNGTGDASETGGNGTGDGDGDEDEASFDEIGKVGWTPGKSLLSGEGA